MSYPWFFHCFYIAISYVINIFQIAAQIFEQLLGIIKDFQQRSV